MEAGRLRQRIVLQARTESRNSFGETTWTWADWKTVFAAVEPISGREYFAASQLQSESKIRVRIRYLSSVTTKHRVKHTVDDVARYYEIESVIPLKHERKEMHLMCKEREEDGWRS